MDMCNATKNECKQLQLILDFTWSAAQILQDILIVTNVKLAHSAAYEVSAD